MEYIVDVDDEPSVVRNGLRYEMRKKEYSRIVRCQNCVRSVPCSFDSIYCLLLGRKFDLNFYCAYGLDG